MKELLGEFTEAILTSGNTLRETSGGTPSGFPEDLLVERPKLLLGKLLEELVKNLPKHS